MKDRVVVVTGAGRGIGRALSLGFARAGASVGLVARNREELSAVSDEIRTAGGRAAAVVADVGNQEQVDRAARSIQSELGRIDILINNAGHNSVGRFGEQSPEEWWRIVEVNLRGSYYFSRAVLGPMVENRWGRIINMSSCSGKVGYPFATAYCAAKHGVIGLTRALAVELGESGVTVNAICPGHVESAMTDGTARQRAQLFGMSEQAIKDYVRAQNPMKVIMVPEDLVATALFLASDGARCTTGEAINVSCGLVMH